MTEAEAAPRIAVPLQIDAAALAGHDPAARVIVLAGKAMGTTWQVHAALPLHRVGEEAWLIAAIEARLAAICRQMSHWDPASCLSRFNHAAPGSCVTLPDDFAHVIAGAGSVATASGGAFDPALGRLTDLWGLGPRPAEGPPGAAALAAALAHSGWRRLRFDPQTAALQQPGGVWLDLSGIAKGFAVDAVADLLAARRLRHVLVEIGGEWAGRGLRPDGDPWWVEIENPPSCTLAPLRAALHGLAVATSGDYLGGAHNIDPRTGHPAVHETTAVSVIAPSCMIADAWATALGVLPFAQAQALARAQRLAARIVARSGEEWLSPALQAML